MSVQTSIKRYNVLSLETIPGGLEKIRPIYDPDSRVSKYIEAKVCFDTPENITFAGHGVIYRPDRCGKFAGFGVCDSCGKVRPLMENCGKITCPVCLRMAASKKAYAITKSKISPYIRFITENSVKNNMAGHYVLSPTDIVPIDKLSDFGVKWYERALIINRMLWDKKNYQTDKQRKDIIQVVREIIAPYLDASVIIFHPCRFENELIKKNLIWSPHFHIVGFRKSTVMEKNRTFLPKDTYYKLGMIFTHISKLPTLKDINKCLAYCLTHTWIHTYTKAKKRRYWKNPDTKVKSDYNMKLEKEYEAYAETIAFENRERSFILSLRDHPLILRSFDEWLIYKSTHSSPCYYYQGLLRPHNSVMISMKRRAEVIDCEIPECNGFMTELIEGAYVIDADSGRMYSPLQMKDQNISVFIYNNHSQFIAIFRDIKMGNYMFRKYWKKKIFLDLTTKIWYQNRYRRKISRRLDIV